MTITHPAEQLPCIVLGLETQIGLCVVRELGEAGVRVIGIAQSPHAIGLRSRYLWRGLVAEQRSKELLLTLQELGKRYGPCPLLAISEVNLLWLMDLTASDLGCVRPVLPPRDALRTALDKSETLALAARMGLSVPQSWQPIGRHDIDERVTAFPLPAVLKWSDPNAVAPRLAEHAIGLSKAEYVHTTAQLAEALSRYDKLGVWPLVQEYCPGQGLGQFFFMSQGTAVRRFQHLRVAEWPPEGGASSVCDALPLTLHVELQNRSEALLRAMGWAGVAMVEHRFDSRSGRCWLMEVNGRFWGSFPLAYHSRAGFALLAYRDALGLPLGTLPPPSDRLRCRMVATELKRLMRIILQPHRIGDVHFVRQPWRELWRFVGDYFARRVRYYVWLARDPFPFVQDVVNALRR